jgi:hypothetical protein
MREEMADMILERKYPNLRKLSVDNHQARFEALEQLSREDVLDMLNVVKVMDRVKPISS